MATGLRTRNHEMLHSRDCIKLLSKRVTVRVMCRVFDSHGTASDESEHGPAVNLQSLGGNVCENIGKE